MGKFCIFAVLYIFSIFLSAQEKNASDVNTPYLEDQFYIGLGYNFLLDKPEPIIQRNLSYHLQLGFIKDIPLNRKRNLGIGFGVGYSTNSYYTNLVVLQSDEGVIYRLGVGEEQFDRSKMETHSIEFPFEFRWRTSNPVDYKFWRIYAGIKGEYLFSRKSKLAGDNLSVFQGETTFSNPNINQWQFGAILNFGYNTWNLHLYYALTAFLDENALFQGERLTITPFRIGLIFYVL
ncbi:MAG: porin family protein [Croceivirga sp.]